MSEKLQEIISQITKAKDERYGTEKNPSKASFDDPRLIKVAAEIISLAKREKLTVVELRSLYELIDLYSDSIKF